MAPVSPITVASRSLRPPSKKLVEGAPARGVPSQRSTVCPFRRARHSIIRPWVRAPPRQPSVLSESSSLSGRPLWAPRLSARDLIHLEAVDRRLAYKNLRTALIAGSVSLVIFALSWVVGLVY